MCKNLRYAIAVMSACLLLCSSRGAAGSEEERLIGWGGEIFRPGVNKTADRYGTNPWIETVSWKPRAFVYHNFLTHAECDHLTEMGERRVSRSLVVDAKTGGSRTDDIRTSYGAAFARGEDSVIAGIEEKIAQWTHVPPENGEPIQILRYVDGQKYDAHWDWFDDPVHHKAYLTAGNRFATVLLYLSEVLEGGETNLPLADPLNEDLQALPNPSECAARSGISVRPRKGDALMFFDMDPGGAQGDRKALHASCPTTKGTKWTATKWLHNKAYMGKFDSLAAAAKCEDLDRTCPKLVAAGGCYKDMERMVGPGGLCRRSCEDCIDCPAGDILCQRKNMRMSARFRGSVKQVDLPAS